MAKNIAIAILIVIVIILIVGGFFLFSKEGKMAAETQVAETQTTAQTGSGVATTPCPDTASMRQELIAAEKAATAAAAEAQAKAKALKAAQKNCRPPLSGGDTLNIRLISSSPKRTSGGASTRGTSTRGAANRTVSTRSTQESSEYSDEYNIREGGNNNTSITEGAAQKTLFCVNVHNGDGASFWPHLGINVGQDIPGAVPNNSNGYNVSVFMTDGIKGNFVVTNQRVE